MIQDKLSIMIVTILKNIYAYKIVHFVVFKQRVISSYHHFCEIKFNIIIYMYNPIILNVYG